MDDTEEYVQDGIAYEQLVCRHCHGSGEGMHDGTRCPYCKGSGVEYVEKEQENG